MATFSRFVRVEGSSWALWEYNDHQTQMNSMYWSGEAARSYSTYNVKNSPKHLLVRDVLKATGPDAGRFPQKKEEWLTAMSELQNWNRASFVLAVTGTFERYLERIVRTALLSDPALVYGKTKAIEGLSWLKLGIDVPHDDIVVSITKGNWSQRYGAFKRLFGEIPIFQHHLGTLDEAREFRNSVGHSFGRNLGASVLTGTRRAQIMLKIKQPSLVKWFGAFSEVAKGIDETLLANHIGDFEPLLHLHTWLVENRKTKTKRDAEFVKIYGKALGGIEGHSKGRVYCSELIAFYDAVE